MTRAPRLEVDEVEPLAELQVVAGLEVEAPGLPVSPDLAKVLLAAHRGVGVDEVGQARHGVVQGRLGGGERRLGLAHLLLQAPPLGGVGPTLRLRELALARGLVLVAQPVALVELGLLGRHPLLRRDGGVQIGVDAAAAAALQDVVASLGEGPGVQHGG